VVKIKKSKLNAYIIALYIFQFGLLQPVASIVNSQWPIAAFTLILILMMFLNNGPRIKKYVVITFVTVSIYFLFNALIFKEGTITILSIFADFILKSFSGFIIGSLLIEGEELYDAFLRISVLNFFAIILFPFVSFLDSMNYMRFGYAMTPSVIMFFYAIVSKRNNNVLWILLGGISFAVTAIYGSRGPLVVFLLFGLLLIIFSRKITNIKRMYLLISTILVAKVIEKYDLAKKAIDYVYFELHIQSYALAKLRIMLTDGVMESSSGREQIYGYITSYIKQNPVFGHGIGFSQITLDFTAHNMFLQILLEAGILGSLIWLCIWIYPLKNYKKMSVIHDVKLFRVSTLLISVAVGRLLVSSDIWLRPELWLVISMLYNFKYHQKYLGKGMIE